MLPKRQTRKTRSLIGFSALCALACDDSEPEPTGPGQASETAFLIGTRVWDATTTTSYFHVAPSLAAGTRIDPTEALEVPGAAKVYAIEGLGWFAVGGGEAPTITRFTLQGSRLIERETISLQEYGVQGLWETLYVVSPTKMYYPDRDGRQLIVINPTDMVVEGAIALPQTEREGFLSLYGYAAMHRGEKLLFSVGWFDWEVDDTVLGETGLVVLDTTTDTVDRFEVDSRCGGITQPITVDSGDTYFISSALAGAAHRLGRLPTKPCALRLLAGATSFDPAYAIELEEITGSSIAGEPIPGSGNSVFLRVFDESIGTVNEHDAAWELTGQTAWRWWRWDVATSEAGLVEALQPSTADVLWFEVDGRVFGSETTADYSETTLIELTASGGPRPALTAPGFLHGLARIR